MRPMTAISLITEALSHAGEDQQLMERLSHLDERRITPDKELPPMEFLFRMFGKPCFPRGELVAITGKAKSGKTFISSILMTLCFCREVLTVQRLVERPLRILWFDTEQSEESTQDILNNRILPMIDASSFVDEDEKASCPSPWGRVGGAFNIFNVRQDVWQERLPLLEAAVHKLRPDFVVVDGIRDLVNDINDGVLAQDVIERLMHLASDTQCCMTCILHQNKGSEDKNLRGWIGTELLNKAFEVYEGTKDGDRIFTWRQIATRKYDILDELKYTVGEDGIPQLCSVEEILKSCNNNSHNSCVNPNGRIAVNPKYLLAYDGNFPILDNKALFTDAFRPGEIKTAVALQEVVMKMANITSYKYYNRCREDALAKGVIKQTAGTGNHIAYTCLLKPSVDVVPPKTDDTQQLNLFAENGSSFGDLPF